MALRVVFLSQPEAAALFPPVRAGTLAAIAASQGGGADLYTLPAGHPAGNPWPPADPNPQPARVAGSYALNDAQWKSLRVPVRLDVRQAEALFPYTMEGTQNAINASGDAGHNLYGVGAPGVVLPGDIANGGGQPTRLPGHYMISRTQLEQLDREHVVLTAREAAHLFPPTPDGSNSVRAKDSSTMAGVDLYPGVIPAVPGPQPPRVAGNYMLSAHEKSRLDAYREGVVAKEKRAVAAQAAPEVLVQLRSDRFKNLTISGIILGSLAVLAVSAAVFGLTAVADLCLQENRFEAAAVASNCSHVAFSTSTGIGIGAGFSVGMHNFVIGTINALAGSPYFIESLFEEGGLVKELKLVTLLWFLVLAFDIATIIVAAAQPGHSETFLVTVLSVGIGAPILAGIISRITLVAVTANQEKPQTGTDIPTRQAPNIPPGV